MRYGEMIWSSTNHSLVIGHLLCPSFFTVGWKRIGEDNKAGSTFLKSYKDYVKKQFNIWSEYIEDLSTPQDERAVNFLPGMGGFLQSLIYGFAGVRVRPEMIEFHNPTPLPQCSYLRLYDFNTWEPT